MKNVFLGSLAKFIFGILGTGGAVTTMPIAYVVTSRNAYETLWKKTWSGGSPICSGKGTNADGKESRKLIVYDSFGGVHDPGKQGGVFRFLQGTVIDGKGLEWNEISKTEIKGMEGVQKNRGLSSWIGYHHFSGYAKKEYGNTDIYEEGGDRICEGVEGNKEEEVVEKVHQLNEGKKGIKYECSSGVFVIECKVSVADGNILDGRDKDKPTVTYSAFYF